MAAQSTIITKNGFQWIDVFNPKKSDIEEIAKTYGLVSTSIQDALDPEHLPKFEKLNTYNFVIMRAYDDKCGTDADTVQELTRKIAIFYNDKFLITIHRKDQTFLSQLREKWKSTIDSLPVFNGAMIFSDILKNIYLTYEIPIDNGLNHLEQFEMGVFSAHKSKPFNLEDGYYLKRQAFVFKRVLRMSQDALAKLMVTNDLGMSTYFQDLRETLESLYFYSDELVENTNALLNLHISLQQQKTTEASHRTNEVMRVLTIFSVFFMPLNFVASIYGMNFENMPELHTEYGYPVVLAAMFSTAGIIFYWFRRKGWL